MSAWWLMGGYWVVAGLRSLVVRRPPSAVRRPSSAGGGTAARRTGGACRPVVMPASPSKTGQTPHTHEKPALTSASPSFLIDPIIRIITMTTNNTMTVVEKTEAGREVRFCLQDCQAI